MDKEKRKAIERETKKQQDELIISGWLITNGFAPLEYAELK